ncbi:MAG: amidase domain-containing protein [Microbacteriaceae bacterium]
MRRGKNGSTTDGERMRRRRWPWIAASVVAIVATAGIGAAIAVPQALDRQDARRELLTVAERLPERAGQLERARADLADARDELVALTASVDAVLGTEVGDRLAPEPVAALAEARDRASAAAEGVVDDALEDAPAPDPEGLDVDELRAETARLERADRAAAEAAQRSADDAELLREAAGGLTDAAGAYAVALGERGAALLGEGEDADDASRAALQTVLDALPTAGAGELGGLLAGYLGGADALVASSDAARAAERSRAAEQQRSHAPAPPQQQAAGSVSAQIDYLLRYVDDYNVAEWGDYNPSGGDCANFVSQGLLQRGVPMDSTWRSGGPGQASTAWVYVPAMDRWLAGKGYERFGLDRLDRLKVGDVGIFDWERNGSGNHTMTVSRIEQSASGPVVYFVSHNRDGAYRELRHVIDVEWPGADAWFYSIP